jgi:UDP-2-acetamido-2-deoxy-ribo-hexuluronate aminotransferase
MQVKDHSVTIQFTGLQQQGALLRASIEARIGKVLSHGQFIMGPEVAELEGALRKFCGAKHCISVANGTDALQIAMMAKNIGPGDAVLVPSFTYTATAEAILVLGAVPVFVEVDGDTFNIDCSKLEGRIADAKSKGLRPAAIIAVDLFGLPANFTELNAIANRHGLFLLADAAQSFGARTASGAHVGTLAPVTTTSFFPAKPLGCYGDGGAIFTEDDQLAAVMRSIRVHGQGTEKYDTVRVGLNSRLDTIQAAVLLSKLEVFAAEIAKRNELAAIYEGRLSNVVKTPRKPDGVVSAWAQYTVRVKNRDHVQKALKDLKVPTAVYYPKPMHLQPAYAAYGDGPGSLPLSEQLSQEVLSLPMNPYYSPADAEAVCDAVTKTIMDRPS